MTKTAAAPYNGQTVGATYANVPSMGYSDNWAEWYCPADCNNGYGTAHSFVEAAAPASTVMYAEAQGYRNQYPGFSLALTPVDGGNGGRTYYGNCRTAGYGPYLDDRRGEILLDNCRRFLAGQPLRNVVDKAHWF